MPLPKYSEVAPSSWMEDAFADSGSISGICRCGRTHFEDDPRAGDFEVGELEHLRLSRDADPDKTIDGGCRFAGIDHQHYVVGCPCNGLRKYEDFLWDNRRGIARYLAARSADQKRAADLDHALVGNLAEVVR